MDFFKSVFSAEPDPSVSADSPRGSPDREDDRGGEDDHGGESPSPNSSAPDFAGGWGFGGLIKTFASKSDSIIQTYRRDLAEFGTGLKKETAAFREAAARAVLDLPGSLDVGASVAQESLESVGQVIDDFGGSVWRGTAEIISQGKEAILSVESGVDSADHYSSEPGPPSTASSSRLYSRYEMQVISVQTDVSTFSEAPEDAEDFSRWRLEFDLAAKEEEIENLCYENGALDGFLNKLVPGVVDYESFWCRYYYRLHKLKQAEDARAKLVKRVISREEEEDLSWDVDDDEVGEEEFKKEEKEEENLDKDGDVNKVEKEEENKNRDAQSTVGPSAEQKPLDIPQVDNFNVLDSKVDEGEKLMTQNPENYESTEGKAEAGGSCKDSDISVISLHNSTPEEDDLEWDEIEDLGEHDDKKDGGSNGTPLKVDLCKRLSAAEEDEDLSWDIEDDDDDDEPSKH